MTDPLFAFYQKESTEQNAYMGIGTIVHQRTVVVLLIVFFFFLICSMVHGTEQMEACIRFAVVLWSPDTYANNGVFWIHEEEKIVGTFLQCKEHYFNQTKSYSFLILAHLPN